MYKQWLLTKRQKVGFCCQIFTPLFSLLLIWSIIYIVRNTDLSPVREASPVDPDGVLPLYIHFGMSVNYNTSATLYNLNNKSTIFNVSNTNRIIRLGSEEESLSSRLSEEIKSFDVERQAPDLYPLDFDFWDKSKKERVPSPRLDWVKSPGFDVNQNNLLLIENLKAQNNIPMGAIENSNFVPDATVFFHRFSGEAGIDGHVQVNSLLKTGYHRNNGVTRFSFVDASVSPLGKKLRNYLVPTEGYISTMNYLNNKFLKLASKGQMKLPAINPLMSITVDSSAILGFLDSGISALAILLFPLALSLGFPLLLFALVLEKEEKIKVLLEVNGLKTRNYWVSIVLFYFLLLTAMTTLFSICGWLFIDTTFFTKISKSVVTLFFIGWNLAQIGFGLFLSVVIKTSINANLVGYLLSVLLTLALSGISFNVFGAPAKMPLFLYLLPHSGYVRFIYIALFDCSYNRCYHSVQDFTPEANRSFYALYLSSLFYLVLGSLIVNKDYLLSKWRSMRSKSVKDTSDTDSIGAMSMMTNEASKMSENRLDLEEGLVDKKEDLSEYSIVAEGLHKVYENGKVALNNFSLKIKKNSIFGLLGPNGAGKTTFLSILTGALTKTSGRVLVEGEEILTGARVSSSIGFCPQFDILWPQLTVDEHIRFFTYFKDYSPPNLEEYIADLIKRLGLSKDYKKMASQLSGGMKRRCSLGNSMTGEPKVIFLDEPSTGLDPVKRREFWELVKYIAVGKAVILTTHLMEEADVLCKEIGIMMKGELKCLGNSVTLKDRFSRGLKIQLVMTQGVSAPELKSALDENLGKWKKDWEFDRTLNITVDSDLKDLSKVFMTMTSLEKKWMICEWSIMQGSLEDVFLNVLKVYGN
jgi:ABC-type multidrug transport system ATPase subunit